MSRKLADLAQAEERRETVREAAADYLRGEWSLKRLRECIERDGVASAPDLWEGMRGLDWDQVEGTVDEGALGLGEFCAIVEETGRALAPTPLVPCVVARTILAGSGSTMTPSLPVLAQREPDRSTDRLRTSATASAADGGFRLRGEKRFVPYGCEADLLIVPARGEDGGVGLFAIAPGSSGVERSALALLDASPAAAIRLNGVEVSDAARIASGERAQRLLREALALETLARTAELVGVAARALELAVEYARTRVAFDRPIGSFQAVQHKLVDLRAHVEIVRALYEWAAGMGADQADERDVAISMAAFAALDGLRAAPEGAMQVFGGIGITWDHDIHFFLRRAATLSALLGERTGFQEDVARHLASSA